MAKVITLHFIVEAKFIVNLSRQKYWYEDNETGAIELLKSFDGMSMLQIMNLINGKAMMTGFSTCDDKKCHQCKGLDEIQYQTTEDKAFIKEIQEREKYLTANYYKIGQWHVDKNKIIEYLVQEKLIKKLSNFGDISSGQEDRIYDLMFDYIFQDIYLKPINPRNLPDAESREFKFAIALRDFLIEYKKDNAKMETIEHLWLIKLREIQRVYTGGDLRVEEMNFKLDEVNRERKDKQITSFLKANKDMGEKDIDAFPCEIEHDGKKIKLGKFEVEQRFLDDYANEVRFNRVMMMYQDSGVMAKEALQHPIQKREAKHRRIYTSLKLPYHGEEKEKLEKTSDGVWELTRLIDDYIVKKYPEIDPDRMFKKMDFINKFMKKSTKSTKKMVRKN